MTEQSDRQNKLMDELNDLRQRTSILQALNDNAADLLAVINQEGKIQYVNPTVRLLDYEPMELVGTHFQEIIHGDDVIAANEIIAEIIKDENRQTRFEVRLRHKNGEWRWLAGSGKLFNTAEGERQVAVNLHDINDLKQVEATLRKRVNELTALQAVALDLTIKQDWLTLLNTIVERARNLINAPSGFIYLYDAATNELTLTVDQAYVKTPGIHLKMGEGMAGWVAQHQQPLIVTDYSQWANRSAQYAATPFHACVEVPMIFGGQLIGVLGANESDEAPRKFDEADLQILALFAAQAASIVHDARLLQSLQRELDERNKAEESFRASEARFRSSFNNAPIGMALVDPQERFLEVNQALCEILGYSADELLSKSVPEVTHPEDLLVEAMYKHSAQTGEIKSFYLEKRYIHADGHIVWGRLSVSSVKKANGELQYYIGQLEDISAQKNLEAALRFRLSELEAIQANVSDLAVQNDLVSLLQTIIERGAQLLNVPSGFIYLYEETSNELILTAERGHSLVVGKRLQMGEGMAGQVAISRRPLIIDDYSSWEGRSKQYSEVPYRAIIEVPMIFNDELIGVLGVNSWGESTRVFNDAEARLLSTFAGQAASAVNNARMLQTIQTELAERIKTETALRESEARFRGIYENSTIGIYRTTPDGQILLNNPALLNMLRYESAEELSQRNLTTEGFAPGHERNIFQRQIEEQGEIRGFESAWKRKDGSTVYVRESARAVRDTSGRTLYYEGTVEDISERKRAELVQAALYQISEASYGTESLENLYPLIHVIVGKLMKAKNFYIALYDRVESVLHFPYFVDEYDTTPQPRKVLGNGLTEYVLLSGKPLLAKPEVYQDLEQTGKVISSGAESIDWLGVPLKTQNSETIGVMVVQSYTESDRYGEAEKDILMFVSTQVAMAIERKQIEEILRENEKRLNHAQTIAHVGNWELDLNTHKMWASEEALYIYGLEYKLPIIPLEVAQNVPLPEYRASLNKALQDLINKQSEYDVEFQIKRVSDGAIRTIHSRAELICAPDGRPVKILGVIQDITASKQAEAALKRSEAFARSIIENEPECVKIVNPDGTLRYMNPAGLAMIEVDHLDQVVNKLIYPIVAPEHRKAFIDLTDQVMRGEQGSLQFEIIGLKGTRRWLDTHAVPLLDEHGRPEALLGLTRDITERKHAEEALRTSEQRFRAIFDKSSVGISLKDSLTGRFLEVNQKYCDISQYTQNELLSIPFLDLTFPDDLEKDNSYMDKLKRREIDDFTIEKRLVRKDGQVIWIKLTVIPLLRQGSELKYHISLVEDITERKNNEEIIRASQQRLSLLIKQSPLAVIEWDTNFRVLSWNPASEKIFGFTAGEAIGQHATELIVPEEVQPQVEQIWEALLSQKGGTHSSIDNVTKHGRHIACEWYNTPLIDPEGIVIGVASLVDDVTERKQAELALRASESRYRAVVENQTEFIVRCKPDGTRTFVNEAYCRYFELTPEQALGTSFLSLVDEADRQAVTEKLYRLAQREGRVETDIHRVIRPDGSIGWQEWTEKAVRAEHGQVVEFQSIGRDITEQVRADARLRESEKKFRLLAETIGEVFWMADPNLQEFHYISPSYESIWGRTCESLYENPLSFVEAIHPDDRARVLEGYQVTQVGLSFEHEYRIIRPDGSLRWVWDRGFPVRADTGEISHFVGAVSDITERKQVEQADTRRRQLLEKVIELGKTVTQVNNLDECLRRIHASIQKELGIDRVGIFLYDRPTNTLTGTYGTSLTGEIEDTHWFSQSANEHQSWQEVLSNPRGISVINDYQEKHPELPAENEMKMVRQHVTISAWAGDTPIAVLAMDNAISQREITPEEVEALHLFAGYIGLAIQNARLNTELERRVIERTIQLEETNKELESFSYSVSHDLRAPLRAISSYARIFQEDFGATLSPDATTVFDNIRISAQNMNNLIEALLQFSRLGRQALSVKPINPSDLVKQALEILSHEQEGRQIELVVSELPSCQGDPALLLQVWVNLLSNAFKYTRQCPVAQIEIGCQTNEAKQHIYFVRDNGIGFDMRYADKLFRVFQRLHGVDEFEGTGIGLALVHRIIVRHGGRIWAESQRNIGTTFYFTL